MMDVAELVVEAEAKVSSVIGGTVSSVIGGTVTAWVDQSNRRRKSLPPIPSASEAQYL